MAIPFKGHDPEVITETYDLVYIKTTEKGYTRLKRGKGFLYVDTNGKKITDPKTLERIQSLVIPPAWEKIWICKKANGHIQVTGTDAKGRKQYRYHPKWQKIRNETKFDRLYFFGKKLKKLRSQLKKDLKRKKYDKKKVTALAISIMQETLIRMGSKAYEKEYGSYGLTTLKNKHVDFSTGKTFFKFTGKKGVIQQKTLKQRSLSNILKKVKEIPGHTLFQFYDNKNNLHALDSSDINNYLKTYMDEDFTGKDFRTWFGCITAINEIITIEEDPENRKKAVITVIDKVAEKLGNTRSICRKYYIHPELLRCFEAGTIREVLPVRQLHADDWEGIEKAFLSFLKKRVAENRIV